MSNQYKNTWFQQEFSLIHFIIDTYYILTSISPLKDAPYTKIYIVYVTFCNSIIVKL